MKPSVETEAIAEMKETARCYTNQALFSDHYLAERMDAHPEWAEDIGDAFAQLQGLYQAKRGILDGLNEAQTEAEFIRPALETLGFAYVLQKGFTHAGRQLRPDYALFADEAAKTEAYGFLKDEGKFYPRALAICDAKYWGRPLDVKREADPRDEFKNTNPCFQIVNYLVGTDVDWGVLTNGRLWRLYYQKARSRASTYYEVDLGLILEHGDLAAFRYFYHFFRQEALVKDPATDRNFLERVYEGSVTYALQVQEELKGLIFERIVPILAEGFVAWRRTERGVAEETKDSLREIFTATLTLLYRLLFLLYAESRELLPVSDRLGYYRYSLIRLKGEAMARLGREEVFSTVSDDLWNDLAALFRIIDRGDPALNVPTYNGGLFDRRSPKNAFLEEHRIADAYLVQALDLLTRRDDPDTGERRFIDYKDLDVRHLGSIYEGLLEFYLRIAQEDLAAVKERGVEVYKPLSEVKESRRLEVVRKGELYLENDKGQRKATGSYYTPDYIVKYIVANTLGPIMGEREAAFAEAMKKCEACRKQLRRARASDTIKLIRDELATLEQRAVNCLLDIKVCDPAMGSGHFLVEAVAYLTDRIIDILNQYPENPILKKLVAIRREILANLEEQGIRIDPGVLTDTNLLKRMVMKRCIYGVDLNPMAVELAKLSLWLDSFTVGAPLSFLDHHLKVGNSLIGARVQKVRAELEKTAEGQYDMFGGPFAGLLTATELMRGVGLRTDATFDELRESAELYAGFERAILPYKRVLDLWVSKHFGNKRAGELLSLHGTEALQAVINEGEGLTSEYQQAIETARQLWGEKRFFHWDLEFPEVFIDLERSDWKQNPGFDAVMGNPPYFSGIRVPDEDLGYLSEKYGDLWAARNDISYYFYVDFVGYLRQGGFIGLIFPRYYLDAHYAVSFREFLAETTKLAELVDTGNYQVFEGVNILTTILVVQAGFAPLDHIFDYKVCSLDKDGLHVEKLYQIRQKCLKRRKWQINVLVQEELFDKLGNETVRLGELVEIGKGMSTGFNKAFELDAQAAEQRFSDKRFLRDLIKNGDIRKYFAKDEGRKVIYPENIERIEDFPEYAQYLRNFEAQLRKRRNYDGPWYKYSTPRNKELWERLGTKIVVPFMATENRFAIESRPVISTSGDVNVLFLKDGVWYSIFYLLALLNSQVLDFYHANTTKLKRGGYMEYVTKQLAKLPICRIEFTTPERERWALVEDVVERYLAYLEHGEDVMILAFVAARLEAEPEEADVIHDLLAYLAEQMIEMHKEKQAEAKGFLDWLADYTGLPIDDWKLKSQVRAYWEHPWSELQRALSQNRKRMRRDVEGREAQEKIKREFEDSMAKLKPLLARIEATDRLIDQIVYRLYGLTEKEIAVVEGAEGRKDEWGEDTK